MIPSGVGVFLARSGRVAFVAGCLLAGLSRPGAGQDGLPAIAGPPAPAAPATVARDAEGRVTMRAIRLDGPLVLDGRLDEEVYRLNPGATDFIQQEPREGAPATERTEVWVLFDRRTVYISARCWDSQPDRILGTEMRRDHGGIFQNDNFSVVLDTFYDRRNGFLFQTNPLGGLRDGLVTEERDNNRDWNTVWDVKAGRFAQGWTIEMAIPFSSLRYRPGRAQLWGVNFLRVVRWKNEFSYLTPIPASYGVRGIFKFSSAATLVGLEAPSESRNLELKPYAISSLESRRATARLDDDLSADGGIDLKYGVTQGLNLDLTYNTDFAQVEDDEQQVNLTRFSLFFPEKRDFFLEGQGIFTFGGVQRQTGGGPPLEAPILFFSRRIGLERGLAVPIIGGGRLTGRAGRFSLGALNIQTNDSELAATPETNFTVLRLRRDILRRSDVGVIYTRRDPSGATPTNQVAGADLNLAFFQDLTLNSYLARSWTPGEDADQSSHRVAVSYAGDRYGLQAERLFVGDGFRPDVGFLRRSGFRRSFAQARFSPRPQAWSAIRKLTWESSLDYIEDVSGRIETRELIGSFQIDLESSDVWSIDYVRTLESLERPFPIADDITLPVGEYRFEEVRTSYRLGSHRALSGQVSAARGSFFSGHRTEVGYSGRLDVSPRLTFEPRVSVNWVDLAEGRFTTRLVGTRTSFTLSPRLALGALLQFNSSTNALGANLRFRWEYAPGSDFFIVYTENRDTRFGDVGRIENRALVVKLTRLFRF